MPKFELPLVGIHTLFRRLPQLLWASFTPPCHLLCRCHLKLARDDFWIYHQDSHDCMCKRFWFRPCVCVTAFDLTRSLLLRQTPPFFISHAASEDPIRKPVHPFSLGILSRKPTKPMGKRIRFLEKMGINPTCILS